MTTHQRTTVILTDETNKVHHIRQTGMPVPVLSEVCLKLGVPFRMDRKKYDGEELVVTANNRRTIDGQ